MNVYRDQACRFLSTCGRRLPTAKRTRYPNGQVPADQAAGGPCPARRRSGPALLQLGRARSARQHPDQIRQPKIVLRAEGESLVNPDSTDELIVGGNLAPVGCGDGPGMGLEGFGQGGEGRTRSWLASPWRFGRYL